MRIRTHKPLPWDPRYETFLQRAGFLHLARAINAGLPEMDGALLTALVDHWRPETHTFHLTCGEMAPLLQDVSYILALRVSGVPVSGTINTEGWRDLVAEFCGVPPPPPPPEGVKDRMTSGVPLSWVRNNFKECPENAYPEVIERYAKVWLWHLVGSFLMPDSSGNTLSWMTLPILSQSWEQIGNYSWGSATLAWLYRQMCEACRRSEKSSNLGGCSYLLQIWIWERIPIGKPLRKSVKVSDYLLFVSLLH